MGCNIRHNKEVKAVAVPDCLFCKIASKEIPAAIVYEDAKFVVIRDINPAAPVHLLIIPRIHLASLNETSDQDVDILGQIQLLAARMAKQENIAQNGYRLVNNCGPWGGQSIYHLHYHLIGGKQLGWPPE
ncbi:MAG: histidine triad nucleotide-binding protein [Syntrophomonadaceae bacterium]|nr:histidine triad nucleotide-binding protein [Syntrophomonadaceae bacterium]